MHKKYFIKFTLLLGLLVIISGCGNRKSVDELQFAPSGGRCCVSQRLPGAGKRLVCL